MGKNNIRLNYFIIVGKIVIKIDERGRIYIPKKYIHKVPNEFYIVEMDKGRFLVPIPKNPLEELEKIGVDIPNISLSELKKEILKQTDEEDVSTCKFSTDMG